MITKHLRNLRLAEVMVLIAFFSACGKSGGEGLYAERKVTIEYMRQTVPGAREF